MSCPFASLLRSFSLRANMERSFNRKERKLKNDELGAADKVIDENGEEITAKSIVSNYFASTTIHGISSIYSGKNIYIKLFWLSVFLSVLGLLVWQILQIFQKFAGNAVVTTHENTAYQGLVFPAVTLCSTLPFNKSFKSFYKEQRKRSKHGSFDFESSTLQSYGISLNEFLIGEESCGFDSSQCNFRKDFQVSSSWLLGNCFTFNANVSRKQEDLGPAHGFEVIMNLNQDRYRQFIYYQDENTLISFPPAGVRVRIHDSDDNIEYFAGAGTILISPGTLTSIKMKKQKIVRLPSPYPDRCANDKDAEKVIGMPLRKGVKYSVELCKFVCISRKKMKYCKAVTMDDGRKLARIFSKGTFSYRTPRNSKEYQCAFRFDMRSNITGTYKCPQACNEQRYIVSTSTGSWPANGQILPMCDELLQAGVSIQNCSKEFIRDNFLSLQIYFEDFILQTIKQIPAYGRSQVISDLGGSVGLWIGASVYSFFELGSTFISLVSLYIVRKKRARKIMQKQVVSFGNGIAFVKAEEGRLEDFGNRSI